LEQNSGFPRPPLAIAQRFGLIVYKDFDIDFPRYSYVIHKHNMHVYFQIEYWSQGKGVEKLV